MHSQELKTIHDDLMLPIPAGSITLNDDRLKQKWTVDIEPFLMAKHPATQALYFAVTGKSPNTFKGDNKPVETVSWKDAALFCNTLSEMLNLETCYIIRSEKEIGFNTKANGYRLPTEAEWEYACKAGSSDVRYGEIDQIAWYKKNSNQSTHDVGQKEPNAWGLHDMLGNVWEWCSDIYDETVYGSYRIFRGGGWCDEERGCMATNRRRSHPTSFKIDDLGFRLARNLV
ncbi:formylglycine-generating enzyme family protein [Owenweeksia hongkongensis]|uniref:formylglycine-generating enzyme family protein n=1 Tax=Owenweeksia hongkongensis TaxID=253245 RepID=UPI003A94CF02